MLSPKHEWICGIKQPDGSIPKVLVVQGQDGRKQLENLRQISQLTFL